MTYACATPVVRHSENPMDTPGHHNEVGYRLIEEGELAAAEREFKRALELAPDFATATAGLALIEAKRGNDDAANTLIEQAQSDADNDAQRAAVQASLIRVLTETQGEGWLAKAESANRKAQRFAPGDPEAPYWMGVAYDQANQYNEARRAFPAGTFS